MKGGKDEGTKKVKGRKSFLWDKERTWNTGGRDLIGTIEAHLNDCSIAIPLYSIRKVET